MGLIITRSRRAWGRGVTLGPLKAHSMDILEYGSIEEFKVRELGFGVFGDLEFGLVGFSASQWAGIFADTDMHPMSV